MVIIFNLWAIPVVVVIYLILLGVGHVFPALMVEPRSGWTIGIVATLVGAVCDLAGIKARVFLLPIWMIGLGMICYHLGWPGTVAFIGLLLVGGIWFFKGAKSKESASWRKVQEEAIKAGPPPAGADEAEFWSWVKATLFLPIFLDFTPDLCRHNLKVLGSIQQAKLPLAPDQKARLDALQKFLATAEIAPKPTKSDLAIQNPIRDLVAARLKMAKRNARQRKLATPPPLPESG